MALPINLFNAEWYLRTYPDVARVVESGLITAEQHFFGFGRFENRAPGPLFDPEYYLATNADVREAVKSGWITAYDHFIQYGAGEGRSPVPFFDKDFYLQQNPDVAKAVEEQHASAVEHFLLYGQNEPRYINPFINLSEYVAANSDLVPAIESGWISPLAHLLTYGIAEGRDLGNGIDLSIFENDPKFAAAIESGDYQAALDRVAEVAPFLPTFEAPEGWEPAEDTPVPLDFTPPEGTKLVVPPSVKVPEGVELPEELSTINLDIDSNTTITFGDQMITRDGARGVFGEVETVDASASTGNITLNLAWESVANGPIFPAATLDLKSVTLGSGNDLLGLNVASFAADDVAIDLGAGADRVLVELNAASEANFALTGGAGADIFAFEGGNIALDDSGFDEDMGWVSIVDFGTGADTIALENFANFDNSFAAAGDVTVALEGLATLYDAVVEVSTVVAAAGPETIYAQFEFGDTTYLYGKANADASSVAGDLLIDLNGVVLSAVDVVAVDVVGVPDWSEALNATGAQS